VNRGDVYRVSDRLPARGGKPGYYVVVSREFVVQNDRISTVVCAPVYGELAGASTEVVIGPESGIPRLSAVRCDFVALLFKSSLTRRVGRLSEAKIAELNGALARALDLPGG
jgi:mRNA-degrading endonuclease toxin of MazEF toxin-antitoxin module